MAAAAAASALLLAACGSSPSAPTTPAPSEHAGPARAFAFKGRVTGTVTGEPIAGATVTVAGQTVVTGQDGSFSFPDMDQSVEEMTITGAGLVTRVTRVTVSDRDLLVDAIQERPPFDLSFFRQLGRNALESETGLEPLRPIASSPRIHIRTVDETGRPMDGTVLDLVEAALRDVGSAWSAERFPVDVIERGPATRQGQSGWITVLFASSRGDGTCGRATLGSTTGRIELTYGSDGCSCGGHVIAPRTVRHELGHIYGYWHTGVRGGVMSKNWTTRQCDGRPSAREIEHARYMYQRAAGNLDPDTDPPATVLRERGEIIVID